ncbi:MAG: AAA family ATPase [Alphaproteobacteria bacterium]|nr:AAA family ATPase [Alphaproteobacteria bacterium]
MAILNHLGLKNFGCFPEASLALAPLSVLVGPNDSGKSTLLKSVLAYRALCSDQVDLPKDLGMPALAWAPAGGPVAERFSIDLGGRLGPKEFSVQTEIRPSHPAQNLHQTLHSAPFRFSSSPEGLFKSPDSASNTGPGRYGCWLNRTPQGVGADANSFQALARLRAALSSIRCFRLDPDVLRRPTAAATTPEVPMLGERGEGLATVLSVLSGADWRNLARIEEQLVARVPTLERFRVLPTPSGNHRLVFRLKGRSQDIEASQVSDGALLFLAFLTLLHHPSPPAVLLIEEPENGVHPGRLRFILRMLRELTAGDAHRPPTSVLMTTHSPYLLDEVQPHEAFFCRRGDDGAATVRRFDAIPDIQQRLADYGLGELWTAFGEDELARMADAT